MFTELSEFCQERLKLLSAYREATKNYAEIVDKLADLAGLGLQSEFDVLRRACRIGWESAEKARLALFRHEADHCCDRGHQQAKAAGAG